MIENIKAVAADIDMTLTAKGGDLPEITKQAFDILHEHGVMLGLATGREMDERLQNQAEFWHLSYPFDFLVAMNGGQVSDIYHEDRWEMDLLQPEQMKEVLNVMMPIVDQYQVSVNVEGGGNHAAMNIAGDMFEAMKRHGWIFEDCTGDIDAFCAKPCFKFLFRTTPDVEKIIRQVIKDRFSDRYQGIGTFPGTVELMQKGIDKGSGLERFAKRNNIGIDEIIAFGDNENDNTMLVKAGWGVSLKDGAAGTKAVADDITEYDCEEGGVGHYLMKHFIQPKGWL